MFENKGGVLEYQNLEKKFENLQPKIADSSITKEKKDDLTCDETRLQPRRVWSILVENLKHSGHKTLFSLCGGLRNVCFEGNTLIVALDDDVSYDILTKQTNFEKVEVFLKQIDRRFDLKFKLNKKNGDIEKNIEKLKSLFDNNLFVK